MTDIAREKLPLGISLQEYYALDAAHREPEIRDTIRSIDLGAEFLIVYFDFGEPLFVRIERGYCTSQTQPGMLPVAEG